MGLSHTVSEKNAISVENRKFFTPRVFNAPAEGFPMELGNTRRPQETRMIEQAEKKFDDICSRLDTIGLHERDWRTDGQTDRHQPTAKQRRRLRRRSVKTKKEIARFNVIRVLVLDSARWYSASVKENLPYYNKINCGC